MATERLLTIREAAARLSLARSTLRRWAARGRLHQVRLGRAVRLRESEINALVRSGLKPWISDDGDHGE